ncbi:MAG: hypothetical protein GY856_02425 [bacterium]|nr:hypothetical protein [bacterium]
MKPLVLSLILGLLAAAAAPLWGGTVYVPLMIDRNVADNQIETEVRITNDSSLSRSFSYVFIPEMTDGTTVDRAAKVTTSVPPHATVSLAELVSPGQQGMLEINADTRLAITSRLVGTSPQGTRRTGAEMPVVTTRNAIPAGETAVLQGLFRSAGSQESDVYLLNSSSQASLCAVEVFRSNGNRLFAATLTLPALSLRGFDDALGLLGVVHGEDASIATTCDQPSHPFARVRDLGTGEVLFIPPSGRSFDEFSCPDTALYQLGGVFHAPTPGNERAEYDILIEGGRTFSKITIDLEFTHGGWNTASDANHAVVWFYRADRWRSNTFAYVNLFGPQKNIAKMITNVDISPSVDSVQKGAVFAEGATYRLHFEYDTGNDRIEALFTTTDGEEVVRLVGTPTVNHIVTEDPGFSVVFGHTTDEAGPEVPTYGWQYANLCIRIE